MRICALAILPLTAAAATDAHMRIIPDWTVYGVCIVAMLNSFCGGITVSNALAGGILWGGILCLLGGCGGGDIKLTAAMGLLLGWYNAGLVLLTALLLLIIAGLTMGKKAMPFAVYLLTAFLLFLLL